MEVSSVLSVEFISVLCICILRDFLIRKTFVYITILVIILI